MARTIDRIPFHGFRFSGTRFDCGNRAGFVEATIAFALDREDMRERTMEMLRRVVADN